uniref:Uncharacterized protein n=1 Tax=Pinguiococcus pyrenoidosus TaxID=172671 RepID=A0A7R9UCA1_9STRA|mmetsp:Transcript_4449/g.17512  ORF Transcript_4449/g.17512 Transcript_4449/m.17512 type:complete len:289 (+) Transcript_4449:160-1026(+)
MVVVSATAFSQVLFSAAVVAMSIIPRKPGDGSFFGGNLSRPFRKLLFCQFLIHLAAQFVFKDKDSVLYSTSLYWSCIALEGCGFIFVCLLVPYLIQVRRFELEQHWHENSGSHSPWCLQSKLAHRVNIPSYMRLLPWVQLYVPLAVVAVALNVWTESKIGWIVKKLADASSAIPVLRTLRLSEAVTGHRMTASSFKVMEWCFVLSCLGSCAAFYAETFWTDHKMQFQGYKIYGHFAAWSRLLMHGLFLNESEAAYEASTASSPERNEDHRTASGAAHEHAHVGGMVPV